MKLKNLRTLLLLAISLFAYSCGGGGDLIEEDVETGDSDINATLTVSTQSIKAPVIGNTSTIVVESSGNWSAEVSDKEWIKIFPSSGSAGKTEVEISTWENDSYRERNGSVTFISGKKKVSIDIAQRWAYSFTLPCSTYKIGYGGGDVEILGLTDDKFTITIAGEASSWVNAVDNLLEVAYNEAEGSRSANISITDKADNKTYQVTLLQDGSGSNTNILGLSELVIDGYTCPTDSRTEECDFMYAVDMDKNGTTHSYKVTFHGEGVQWITIGNGSKKYYSGDVISFSNMRSNTTIKIYTHSKSTSKRGINNLIISGLPLVEVISQSDIVDEPKVSCKFRLFDPKARTDDGDNKNLKYFESNAGIEFRGAGALRYVKKPYNFKLYDSAGNKREAELLNIRNDNSWILDAMFLDVAHMRNRVCFDIWNEFNKPYYVDQEPKAMSGTRGHFVEMFINGAYMGMFILSDRIDRKQYQLNREGGYIYKAKGWTDACRLRACNTPSNDDYYWNSADIEQDYPDADDGRDPNFNHMAEMIKFVGSSSEEEFDANFEQHFDMNSIVDGFIFLNMIVAHDNIGRNTFWIIRNVHESKKFIHGLWDLDGTLGRTWNRYTENPNQGWVSSGFRIYERIISENPANIHQKIYDRWNEIKNGALSPANFAEKIEAYAELQVASGARDREVARWKQIDMNDRSHWGYADVYYDNIDQEVTYMKDWWTTRHAKLNSLINTLQHN